MAPNTRVQRTRSSPSALRSPLTRNPLGLLGAIAVALGASCSGASSQQSTVPEPSQLAARCRTHPQNTDPQVTPPHLIRRVEPKVAPTDPSPVYVCLDATVTTDGTLTDVKVLKSGGGAMDTAALEAVRQWRYSPATRDGVPIAFPINIGISMTTR
jgi:TonB family protein